MAKVNDHSALSAGGNQLNVDANAFRALSEQVAGLSAEVEELKHQAFILRSLEETRLLRFGCAPPLGYKGVPKPSRPSYLRPVPPDIIA